MAALEDTMKKIILLLAVLALSFGAFSCGGGGAGSANNPGGENPGVPSLVQLSPSHFIAHTNSNITFHAKVLDGNGVPLRGVAVTFTNLSEPFGVLTALGSSSTVAVTNDLGIASMNLYSTTPGFATVLAQVYNGVGTIRDRKSVFFTPLDVIAVSMDIGVDSVPGNGIFDEVGDVTLFQDPPVTQPDDTVKVRVTVRDAGGVPVGGGMGVTWSSSHAEAKFIRTDTLTSVSGVAEAVVQVTPSSIRNTDTLVNVFAFADNGAANMVTLFLRPVVIDPSKSSVTANPNVVLTAGTSDVTAVVFLNTGATAPDGTVVNFSTAPKTSADPSPCGTITPFVATTGGVTTPVAKFNAPAVPGVCTVTAKSGGVTIGSVDITVIAKLEVVPDKITIDGAAGGTATFTIFGGLAPYTVTSDNSAFPPTPATVTASGGTFSVTVPPSTPATTVTYTIRDKTGTSVKATLAISGAGALKVTPSTASISCGTASALFIVTGGVPPYTITSTNSALPVTSPVAASGGSFTSGPAPCVSFPAPSTAVAVIVTDSAASPAITTATVTVTNP